MKEKDLLSLIECLYDTALEPARWSDFAPVVARAFGGMSGVVQAQEPGKNLVHRLATTANYTQEANEAYREHFYKHDLWVTGLVARGVGNLYLRSYLGRELVPPEVFFRSVHYNEFCKTVGIGWVLGSVFPVADGALGIIGVHRAPESTGFDIPDKLMMDHFLPHLKRALQIHMKLGAAGLVGRATLDVVSALDAGILIVDARCRIVFLNPVAEAMLRLGMGATITRGELRPQDPRLRARLEALVAAAASAGAGRGLGAGGVLALPRPSGQPLSLLVCPLRAGEGGFGSATPMALVFVSDPDGGTPAPESVLQELYGLTPAEARLLAALLEGERLKDYADRVRLTMNTVRTQLAHIFAKTGQNRQAELVRTCLSDLVIRMAARRPSGVAGWRRSAERTLSPVHR